MGFSLHYILISLLLYLFFVFRYFREVLASEAVLDLPDRVDWKNCKVSKEEETILTKAFRKRFQPFDFNFT